MTSVVETHRSQMIAKLFLLIFVASLCGLPQAEGSCGCNSNNNFFYFFDWRAFVNISGLNGFIPFLNQNCGCSSDTTTPMPFSSRLSPEQKAFLKNFTDQYGITFQNADEEYDAWENLSEDQLEIAENNRLYELGESDFERVLYPFSYLSNEKFDNEFLGLIPAERTIAPSVSSALRVSAAASPPKIVRPECQNLPVSKNWAKEGKMIPIQEQNPCGCCYVFSSVGVLESTVAIKTGNFKALSVQNTLECVKTFGVSGLKGTGCDAGRPEWIWNYARDKVGLVLSSSYGVFNANSNGACSASLARDPNAEVDHWEQIPMKDEEAMKCHIATVGPLSIEMKVGSTSFDTYKSGIWDDPEKNCTGKPTDHAMILVGYGTGPNRKGVQTNFWIIQNSWDKAWGEEGFIRVERGINLCSIGVSALFPVLKTDPPAPLKAVNPMESCEYVTDIYDSNKVYLKSACFDKYSATYDGGRDWCYQNGNRLYQLGSAVADAALFSFAKLKFTDSDINQSFFVQGKSAAGCSIINNGASPFLEPYKLETAACAVSTRAVCEFINYAPTPPA